MPKPSPLNLTFGCRGPVPFDWGPLPREARNDAVSGQLANVAAYCLVRLGMSACVGADAPSRPLSNPSARAIENSYATGSNAGPVRIMYPCRTPGRTCMRTLGFLVLHAAIRPQYALWRHAILVAPQHLCGPMQCP